MPTDPSGLLGLEPIAIAEHALVDEVGNRPTPTASLVAGPVVFEILVATMWSVGELVATEVERSRGVAVALQLRDMRGGSAFGTIAAGALPFTDIAFELLTEAEGRLAYAAAAWISAVSVASDRRAGFLRGLKLRLRLGEREATSLVELAQSVDAASDSVQAAFALLASRVG